jgi:hypothetical protein
MLLALDKEGELYLFASTADAESWLETIDIENGEYEFCSDRGQRFLAEVSSPVTAFRGGAFFLRPEGLFDPHLPSSFAKRARHLGRACDDIRSLEELKTHIEHTQA